MLTVDVISSSRELLSFKDEWQRLVEISSHKNIFHSIEWLSLNYKHFYKNGSLQVIVIKDSGKVVAIAPFVIEREKIGKINVRKVKFLSESWVDNFDIIIADEGHRYHSLKAILSYLFKNHTMWDVIAFEKVLEDSATLKILSEVIEEIARVHHITRVDTRTSHIVLDRSWDEYYLSRYAKLRRNIRNRTKRIEKLGKLTFKRYSGSSLRSWEEKDIDGLIKKIISLSKVSWQGNSQEGTAISDQRVQKFFIELSRCFAKKGWLDISLLLLNERLIAFRYGFIYEDVLIDLKPGYDPEFFTYSPGRLLLAEVIRDSMKRNIREINMMHEFLEFKREWTTEERVTKQIIVFNRTMIPVITYYYYFRLKPFIRKIVKGDIINQH